jgi:superfamily I DNA/RNA helicase
MRMKNVNQLFSWMTEMLEGSEIDEPMTLTQVVTRFTLRDMMERGESEEELDQVQLMTCMPQRAGVPVCLSGGHGRGIAAAPEQH